MRNIITELGIKCILLFPILSLFSCHANTGKDEVNSHHTDTVVIHQMQFNPAEIAITKGDTIVWINKDLVDHNVTEEKSKAFVSDTIHVGKMWKRAFTTDANYYCTIHPTMKGKIIIK